MSRSYSPVKKGIAIIIQLACAVAMVVSVYVLIASFDKNMFTDGRFAEADYFTTDYFRRDATKEIKRLLYYAQLRNNFEVEGSFDLNKVVDVKDYIERDVISGYNRNGIAYVMGDLIEWGRWGIDKETHTFKDNTGMEVTVKNALTEKCAVWDGNATSLEGLYRMGFFETTDKYLGWVDYIDRTIRALPADINKYKEENTHFKAENSNIRYVITCNGEWYTNMEFAGMKEKVTGDYLKSYIQEQGVYMHIDSNTFSFDSSFSDIESEMYKYLDSLQSFDNSRYAVYLFIDKNLPAADAIKQSYDNYQNLRPWFWTCVIMGIVSIIGVICSVVYLAVTAGYENSKKREVKLALIDKLYTEVTFLIGLLVLGILSYEIYKYYVDRFVGSDIVSNLIFFGAMALGIDAILLTVFLSFVRRRRAGNLYSNSLFYAVTSPVKTAIGTKVITVRVVVRYALAVAVFLGLSYLGFYRKIFPALVILGVLIVYVGTVLIKESFLRKRVIDGAAKIADGDLEYKIDLEGLKSDNLVIGEIINEAGEGISRSVEERIKSEKLKADLITNVSHDIKTPLTSIINYVELLKREDISDPKVQGYIRVLEEKSLRLKHLTEDLVEASKISSGNIEITLSEINLNELINQTEGEFVEKFGARNLELVTTLPEKQVYILADGMRIWRVIENLYNNVAKYAMMGTRVYVDLSVKGDNAELSIKNISQQALNIEADELTERFIRGDISRSTEGSGLGLSIARSLTTLQGGTFNIYLDGDLFKVTVAFPIVKRDIQEISNNTEETHD
ncbi:MAG: HAMP domain-containing histidine kinase [Lachnospiraceae bacterium]|nr:HAMP domain-containing histidine kinase [Lachnospiraceae bacterium]